MDWDWLDPQERREKIMTTRRITVIKTWITMVDIEVPEEFTNEEIQDAATNVGNDGYTWDTTDLLDPNTHEPII